MDAAAEAGAKLIEAAQPDGQLDVDELAELVARDERPPAPKAVRGELVSPADELVGAFAATLVARPQTQRTYARACARFARWLCPLAGPQDLTAANVARYHAALVAGGRSSATVKKDRAALNSFLRWLAEHGRVPAEQVRERWRCGCRAPSGRSASRPRRSAPPNTNGSSARRRHASPTTRSPAPAT